MPNTIFLDFETQIHARKPSITEAYWKDTARAALSLPPSPTPYLLSPTVSAFFPSLLLNFPKQAPADPPVGAGGPASEDFLR